MQNTQKRERGEGAKRTGRMGPAWTDRRSRTSRTSPPSPTTRTARWDKTEVCGATGTKNAKGHTTLVDGMVLREASHHARWVCGIDIGSMGLFSVTRPLITLAGFLSRWEKGGVRTPNRRVAVRGGFRGSWCAHGPLVLRAKLRSETGDREFWGHVTAPKRRLDMFPKFLVCGTSYRKSGDTRWGVVQ